MDNSTKQISEMSMDEIRRYFCLLANDKECTEFQQLCIHHKLNPWVKDAYLVKYKPKLGKQQLPAKMIVGKDVYLKRANKNSQYAGHEAGIIIKRNGDIVESQGTFIVSTDSLLGGWAKVYKKDMQCPTYFSVLLSQFKGINLWNTMPGIMIRKVALVSCFREAFPEEFQGLYIAEEMQVEINEKPVAEKKETKKKEDLAPINLNSDEQVKTHGEFEFLKDAGKAKESITNEPYYQVLNRYGYKHANEVKVKDQEHILIEMREIYTQQQEKCSDG